jgi:hypothetical protein
MEFHVAMGFIVALVVGMLIEAYFGPLGRIGLGG